MFTAEWHESDTFHLLELSLISPLHDEISRHLQTFPVVNKQPYEVRWGLTPPNDFINSHMEPLAGR